MNEQTQNWIRQDKAHCWHPFTQQTEWTAPDHEPLVLERGEGVWLYDSEGRRYLDANSSIWTNIHGHSHPALNRAIQQQLDKVAHTSYLGFSNPKASELAERLCNFFPQGTLSRCFFSDDGSTALEVAMKMSLQSRLQTGEEERNGFITFQNAYHGDTMGAAALGGVSRFFDRFQKLGLPVHCVSDFKELETHFSLEDLKNITAVVIEPVIQGVNQMTPWPIGMLQCLRRWTQHHGIHLILDEVMTGFGRTGELFACQRESVIPDFLCLAKGLTGGYMPLAATLTKEEIYNTFLGAPDNTFYYGHSYTGNQLGCAVALASLDLFESEHTLQNVAKRSAELHEGLKKLSDQYTLIKEVRQVGLVAGIELSGEDAELGKQFCLQLRTHEVLTRPILNTIVIMPPLTITKSELNHLLEKIRICFESINRS